ncbi:FMN reductase, partial [Burkholderia glumae]
CSDTKVAGQLETVGAQAAEFALAFASHRAATAVVADGGEFAPVLKFASN